jgi:hypothetical protein
MKNIFRVSGITVLAAVIVFSMTACSGGGAGGGGNYSGKPVNPGGPASATYVSYGNDGTRYELVITEVIKTSGRAAVAYTPKAGDKYTLTITFANGDEVTSSGTVSPASSVTIVLIHSSGEKVTVKLNSDGMYIESFDNDIPVDAKAASGNNNNQGNDNNQGNNNNQGGNGNGNKVKNPGTLIPATKQQVGITVTYLVEDISGISIVGQDGGVIPNNTVTVSYGVNVTFTAGGSYTGQNWTINGVDTEVSSANFTFSTAGRETGRNYIVGLKVQKGGKYYSTQITVKVQE